MSGTNRAELRQFILSLLEGGPKADHEIELEFVNWNASGFHLSDLKAELESLAADSTRPIHVENRQIPTFDQAHRRLGTFTYETVFSLSE